MKPFDLSRALSGDEVVTRDGRKVLQIAYFPSIKSIAVLIEDNNYILIISEDGKVNSICGDCNYDLFMAPKKINGYIAIAKYKESEFSYSTSNFYVSLDKLKSHLEGENFQIIEVEIDE